MYVCAFVHELRCIRFDATICYSDDTEEILLLSNENNHDAGSGGAGGGGGGEWERWTLLPIIDDVSHLKYIGPSFSCVLCVRSNTVAFGVFLVTKLHKF